MECLLDRDANFGEIYHEFDVDITENILKRLLSKISLLCYQTEASTKWTPFPNDIFKYIFMNDNVWIPINVSLKFVPKGPINNILALIHYLN